MLGLCYADCKTYKAEKGCKVMLYTVALIYIAVIVFLEVSHRRERERIRGGVILKEKKPPCGRHFSPHRKAIERLRREKE